MASESGSKAGSALAGAAAMLVLLAITGVVIVVGGLFPVAASKGSGGAVDSMPKLMLTQLQSAGGRA